jgi:hypothetical protein
MTLRSATLYISCLVLAACGGSDDTTETAQGTAGTGGTVSPGTGGGLPGSGGAIADSSVDAPGDVGTPDGASDAASFACGTATCAGNQICIHGSCNGTTVPDCVAPNSKTGLCQDGWSYATSCPPFPAGSPGCKPPPCGTPVLSCVDAPAACASTIACSCITAAACSGYVTCQKVENGRDVYCSP